MRNTIALISIFLIVSIETSLASSASSSSRKLVVGVDGGTESIRACCFDAKTGRVVGKSVATPYQTHHPKPGWAEQRPNDWWECMGHSVRGCVESVPKDDDGIENEFCGICVDTTCCSVVALDDNNEPLRNCLLWMDARSAPQTEEILKKCKGDPALLVNSGGQGPISAEWLTPKALWIRQNEPEIWKKAKTICEYQDFINYKMTGEITASSCNASSRWHWNGEDCILQSSEENPFPGRPMSMYKTLGIPELASKLPQRCLPPGALVGNLSEEAAKHLNLPVGLPVAQGGADAFIGMIGLGCINPGQLCLITGSSHLHCVVSAKTNNKEGIWGPYRGAPLSTINFAEGGQSSTGSLIRWARGIFGANDIEYSVLDAEAAKIPPGCDGLVALETFQGSRTPVTDPKARGALVGLTLIHTRAHVFRALLEGVCYGTRACIEGLAKAGHTCDEIIIAGGATRSTLWLQMHADVTGKPVVVCENSDAPLLGCAILASFNSKVHSTVHAAVSAMVRVKGRVDPSEKEFMTYSKIYNDIYTKIAPSVQPISHSIADSIADFPRGGTLKEKEATEESRLPIVSPSLLACDWSIMKTEITRCIDAGASRLHVDIFDGVFLDSPVAFTFGPQMVAALRRCSEKVTLDLHMCVDRPGRYVIPMKKAGANLFIFQWEAMEDENEALQLAKAIIDSGMDCGLSINPSTPVDDIIPFLMSGLVKVVDVLAVEPGFGGQIFQTKTNNKIEQLKSLKDDSSLTFDIMVDGGINETTAKQVSKADVIVAGTFLFNHPESLSKGVHDLLASTST